MIQVTPHMRIALAVEPADFRKGIDGLAALCRKELKTDPFSGTMFVFRNRRKTSIKILCYDGQGFWVFQKRLSHGRFHWWPKPFEDRLHPLAVHELQLLIWNGNPSRSEVSPDWRPIPN
jgi:hypothetical protein